MIPVGINMLYNGLNVGNCEHEREVTFVLNDADALLDLFFMCNMVFPEDEDIATALFDRMKNQIDGCRFAAPFSPIKPTIDPFGTQNDTSSRRKSG
jgi:hypothetical protein